MVKCSDLPRARVCGDLFPLAEASLMYASGVTSIEGIRTPACK